MPTLPTGFTAIRLASARMDMHDTHVPVVQVRLPHRLPGDVMKSQRRLRLRQAGKHHGDWRPWRTVLGIRCHVDHFSNNMACAFEMNCMPKHSTDGLEPIGYTMDYVTGKTTFHAPEILQPHAFVDMHHHAVERGGRLLLDRN